MKNLLAGMNNVLFDGIPVKVEISSPTAPDYAFKINDKKRDHRNGNHKSNKKRK